MNFEKSLDAIQRVIESSDLAAVAQVKRILTEINFAVQLTELYPENKSQWQPLILRAAQSVQCALFTGGAIDFDSVVRDAEGILSPIGATAKEYTVHCCGHAHIDMNWLWPWQDTVSATHDTFLTVDRLMEEFPAFRFSQSQISVYHAMEEYCPEVFERIKVRIGEGRWEPLAAMWVEGDKNLASGEIICRNVLYSRRYLKEKFGLPYDTVKIDWECDTFGHPYTLPAILNRGGITRHYRHRTRPEHWLIWWKSPDGSKVLSFYDKATYNGPLDESMIKHLVDYVKDTSLKDFLFVYGVGDHGGGPTRRDLIRAEEYQSWPIFPNVRLSSTDEYFSIIEQQVEHIPTVDDELNFVFEGCYTSQSGVKLANRVSENVLPEVEALSLVAGATVGFPYPSEHLLKGWQLAMFNQFHDILPGSGIHATYEHAQGLFQEIQAITGAIRTRALRSLAAKIDTSSASGVEPATGGLGASIGDGIGAGAGDPTIPGGISAYNVGAVDAEPFVVFNQLPFPRSGVLNAKIWNKVIPDDKIVVRDDEGHEIKAQVIKKGDYWGHQFTEFLFPVKDVPATGYRVYTAMRSADASEPEGVKLTPSLHSWPFAPQWLEITPPVVMENEFVRVEMDLASGAIKSLIDKSTGWEMVPEGQLLGVLELVQEAPRGMSAWEIGQIARVAPLISDGKLQIVHRGPHRAAVATTRKVNDSTITVEVGLSADSAMVDFTVTADWLERGTEETGVPMLRIAFPVDITETKATYEIPFGSISRPANGNEVPALKWADLSGKRASADGAFGITLVNDCKYGHSADGNTLRLTLLRSSFGPDPLPEMGRHTMRFAILPHDGCCSISDAVRAGAAFNLPMNVASTDIHKGSLPASKGFVEVLSSSVMLAGLKKAEDSNAIVLRLYEVDGRAVEAQIRLRDIAKPGAVAKEVDLMEQPITPSSAKMEGDTLFVNIPAYGIASVIVG